MIPVLAARRRILAPREPPAWLIGAGLAIGAVVAGLAAGQLVQTGRATHILWFVALALPIILWRRPGLAPVLLLTAGLTVEQSPYLVGTRNGAFTDRIPLFHGVGHSTHFNPADVLLLGLMVMLVLKSGTAAVRPSSTSAVRSSIVAVLAAVALGLVVGQAHHGALRIALTEIRPYVYLAATFLVASTLVARRSTVHAMLWALILSSAFKATQGILIFLSVRHMQPRPDAVLGHEEAFFFGLYIVVAIALWLFDVPGRLRTTATILLPVVLLGDLVNFRRTGWLILGASLFLLAAIGWVRVPERRRLIARIVAVAACAAVVYFPVYWNHSGALAQPARAVKSFFSPDPRDASSDQYRVQENANLKLNIRQSGLLGKGFGVPIDYAYPIADLRDIDPLITYIPHNGVLYIVMRMGVLGGIAFWSLLAAGILAGSRLTLSRDRELAVVGTLIVCAMVAYALQGYNDQGFFFYRIAFVVGSLLGLGEAARHLDETRPGIADRPSNDR